MGKSLCQGITLFCLAMVAAFFTAGAWLNPPGSIPVETRAAESEPTPEPPKPLRLEIVKAVYGDLPDGPQTDVTAKVTELVANNHLNVPASNGLFGDPAVNIRKASRRLDRWRA